MKKIIYSVIVALTTILCVSCDSKDNEQTVITGNWNYSKPHFEFDYTKDTVSIVMGKAPVSIAVKDLKNMFMRTAGEKMGEYFTGVEFGGKGQMSIKMKMQDGEAAAMRATFLQSADVIQVTLDTNDLKQLTQGTVPKIPAISFKYEANGDDMLLYFDLAYVKTIFSMMSDQIMDMLIGMTGADLSQMGPEQIEGMKTGMMKQITAIIADTRKLEIGFTLKRE